MRHKLSELHENHCQNWLQNRPKMCPKLDQKWLPNWFSNKHFKMNDLGTILDLVLAPKISQKSTLFSAVFLDTSKSCIETILSSTTSPKWNQFWSILGTWRPCDFAAIYYTFERFRTSETVKFPIEFRCLLGDTFFEHLIRFWRLLRVVFRPAFLIFFASIFHRFLTSQIRKSRQDLFPHGAERI